MEPDKNFKTFERKGPGFHMKVGMFSLPMGPEDSDGAVTSEFGEDKKVEVVEEEEEPRKLAPRRFKERKERF
ncbi:hypothetical protein AKJ36_03465 [candidate division MSBL1 archaeon SCGC-AAA259I07]|uniref:Uncharacterized protein n=1 Tax=candidate division MSBL1 archaeon SCGC-AAA259I07 TaxID=1698266 RepID=A0A133UIS6_9EURY|nr:hypothetical protein AKJ36_03465 [candidate division MSBL1 archaeon SCGC-AAA259I07]